MENQINIPRLRFPTFKDKWAKRKLGEIYKFKITNSFSRADLNYDSGIVKNIHYGDIHTQYATLFNIEEESVPYINEAIDIDRISSENYCQIGDLVFADASEDYNDIGKCIEITNLSNEKVLAGLHTLLARPEESKMAIGFAGYLMKTQSVKLQIQREAQGTKVLSITSGRLARLNLVFPTVPEQQKITSFFTAIDQKISQLIRKKTLMVQYKKGIMQKIFAKEIRFKDDNGQEFQKWEKKKLGEVASKVTRKNRDNKVTSVLTNSAINGVVLQRDFFEKDIANQNNLLNYYIIDVDDFVYNPRISSYAPVGPIKRNRICQGVMSPLYSVFKFHTGVLSFYEYFFSTTFWHGYMESIANYGARSDRMNITTVEFYEMPVPFPCIEEQTKIANFLSAIDNKINCTEQQIEKAEVWKKGLMQKMFL